MAHEREGFGVTDCSKLYLARPVPLGTKRWRQHIIGNPTRRDVDEFVRASDAQAQFTLLIDRTTQTSSRTFRWIRCAPQYEVAFDTGDPLQVLSYQCRLPERLCVARGVLEITSSTSSRVRIATRRVDAFGARFADRHGVASRELR
jgi:hypothetical protein